MSDFWWAISQQRKSRQYGERLTRVIDFLLKEFGPDLEREIRAKITQEEIEKLLPRAKKEVLEKEIPKLRDRIEKEYEAKCNSIMQDYLTSFFSSFVPIREQIVESLFVKFHNELGFTNYQNRHLNCDCICERDGKEVKIEFEKASRDFITHKHKVEEIDYVVCWVNNLQYKRDLSVPIIELSKELPRIFADLLKSRS